MKILITGARDGIGYASAIKLLERGHYVYLGVHTNSQLEAIKEIEELKDKNVELLKLDITEESDREKIKKLDIDVLINNAAIGKGGSIIDVDIAKIKENYEVNVFGTIELTKLVLEKMMQKNSGKILMMSSILAEIPFSWLGIYSSTKAAIKSLSFALNKELKELDSNVKVVVIEPGAFHTGFNQVMLDNKYNQDNPIFKNIRNKIHEKEQMVFGILESHDLNSIVDKIVEAIEAENPNIIYKAPVLQSIIEKAYIITKK